MRLFLTGQEGFIGKEILRLAREAGHEVMGLERPFRMANPPWEKISEFAAEACIHCAWIATPGEYLESPQNIDHREWSVALVRKLASMGTRRFVIAGTCAEYGPSQHPLQEGAGASPSTLYGREKNLLRVALEEESVRFGFELLWARIFYPYGPGEHPDRLISFLIRNAIEGRESHLKNPFAVRDYIHVEDLARAFLVLAEAGTPGIYNIGTGQGVRLSEIRKNVLQVFGGASMETATLLPAGSVDEVVADNSRISALGWSPLFDIKKGLLTYPPPRNIIS
jgi:nucleoside-diphosphate-sugar epimerase